jgi:hypothetical protein
MAGAAVVGLEEDRALKREDKRAVWAVRDSRSCVRMGSEEGEGETAVVSSKGYVIVT